MPLFRQALIAASVFLSVFAATFPAKAQDPENTIIITLKDGDVVIELLPDLAPKHAERVKSLVRAGAYDNVVFHRVIPGFMAQTGDVQYGNAEKNYSPSQAGTGGSDQPDLKAEFSKEPFKRGVVGMARAANPDSANSQFFIMFDDGEFLNGDYTVFGRVISGMEHVDAIKKGSESQNGVVADPDRMIKVVVQADKK